MKLMILYRTRLMKNNRNRKNQGIIKAKNKGMVRMKIKNKR